MLPVSLVAACSASEPPPIGAPEPPSTLTDDDDLVHDPGEGAGADPVSDGVDDEPEGDLPADGPSGPPPAPEAPPPVELSQDEVLPEAKRLASEVVQLLTTYEPDDRAGDVAARLVDDDEVDELVRVIAPLHHEGAWSRGEIVYPQLGGATRTDASVMVVVRQTVGLPDGSSREETRTIDVRLTMRDDAWTFASIEDAGGEPVPRPAGLPPEAVAVLDDDRIELPDSAVWDIHAGRTDPRLLAVMSEIAERHRYGVAVLETGHPIRIFDTDRISLHLYGLAVDIYHLDGELIVDAREEGSPLHMLVEWLYDQPAVTNIGSPWALDGFGGRSFTDLVHQDHVHVEAGRRPAGPPAHRDDLIDEHAG